KPFVKGDDFIQPVASPLDIEGWDFFCRCRDRRLFVSAVVGSFTTHSYAPLLNALNIEKVFRDTNDVLQIKQPPQDHLDRERGHAQQKERHKVKPNRSECRVETFEPFLR